MGGGGPTSTSVTQPTPASIPPALQPLVSSAAAGTIAAQQGNPLTEYIGQHIQDIPGLTPWQQAIITGMVAQPAEIGQAMMGQGDPNSLGANMVRPYQEGMGMVGQGSQYMQGGAFNPNQGLAGQMTLQNAYNPYQGEAAAGTRGSSFNPYQGEAAAATRASSVNPFLGEAAAGTRGSSFNPYQGQAAAGLQGNMANPYQGQAAAGLGANMTNPYQSQAGGMIQGAGGVTAPESSAYGMLTGGGIPDVTSQNVGVNTDTQQMNEAMRLANTLAGGEIGQSAATQAGMKAWDQLVRPGVLSGSAITGNLGGGATQEALAQSSTAAAVPLIQQEVANRAALVPQLGQLGLGASGQHLAADTTTAQLGERASEANAANRLSIAGQLAALGGQEGSRALQSGTALGQLGLSGAQLGQAGAQALGQLGLSGAQLGQQGAQLLGQLGLSGADLGLRGASQLGQLGLSSADLGLRGAGQLGQLGLSGADLGLRGAGQLGQLGLSGAQLGQSAAGQYGQLGLSGAQLMQGAGQGMGQLGGQMANIGGAQAQLFMQQQAQALEASGMPREVAMQQAQANYNDYLRRQALAEQTTLGPTGQYLAGALTPGSITSSQQSGGGIFGS